MNVLNKSFISTSWFPGSVESDYPHYRFFSKQGFRQFIQRNGFEIVQDWTSKRAGLLGKVTQHQLFLPGPTLLCKIY